MSRPPKFSPRRLEILEFIRQYVIDNHFPPTTREMAKHLKTSTSVANYYLGQLEKEGVIEITRKISRGVHILGKNEIITIYRCALYPDCQLHCIVPGECSDHHIKMLPIQYREV